MSTGLLTTTASVIPSIMIDVLTMTGGDSRRHVPMSRRQANQETRHVL